MKNAFIILLAIFFLASCSHKQAKQDFWTDSFVTTNITEEVIIRNIVDDATKYLSEHYPPGHTALFILHPATTNLFSTMFENKLRQQGFTVSSDSASETLTLAYILDSLDNETDIQGALYLHFYLSDGRSIARVYDFLGRPDAAYSSTQLDASKIQKMIDIKAKYPNSPVTEEK